MENRADKLLVYTAVIDRPRTTRRFIETFINHTDLDSVHWVMVDNNSNAETKRVLQDYFGMYHELVEHPFNYGPTFSFNEVMAKRLPGQHVLCANVDAFIMNPDWLDIMMNFAKKPGIGLISGRRPTLWTDPVDPGRFHYYKNNVDLADIDGLIVEFPRDNSMIFPWCLVKSEIIDKIGYMDESLNTDDTDYSRRVTPLGLKNVYIPDVCILQYHNEVQEHPEYGAYRELVTKACQISVNIDYSQDIRYRGTRFLPETIKDDWYKADSDRNFEFFRTYQQLVKTRKQRRQDMKITKQVEEILAKGEKIKLDVGAGYHREPGFIRLDRAEKCEPDILCDLDIDGIPLPDSCVSELRAIAVLEHCSNTIAMINEIWRVCENGAKVHIVVPHSANDKSLVDPTHKSFFSERSPSYWDRRSGHYTTPNAGSDYGVKAMFKDTQVLIDLDEEVAAMPPEDQRFALKFFRNVINGITITMTVEK